jgi:hypothetical protein
MSGPLLRRCKDDVPARYMSRGQWRKGGYARETTISEVVIGVDCSDGRHDEYAKSSVNPSQSINPHYEPRA